MNEKRWLLKSILCESTKKKCVPKSILRESTNKKCVPKSILCESTKKNCIPKSFFFESVTSTGTIFNSTDRIFSSNDHPSVNYNPITTIIFFSTVQHYIHDEKNLLHMPVSNITY